MLRIASRKVTCLQRNQDSVPFHRNTQVEQCFPIIYKRWAVFWMYFGVTYPTLKQAINVSNHTLFRWHLVFACSVRHLKTVPICLLRYAQARLSHAPVQISVLPHRQFIFHGLVEHLSTNVSANQLSIFEACIRLQFGAQLVPPLLFM